MFRNSLISIVVVGFSLLPLGTLCAEEVIFNQLNFPPKSIQTADGKFKGVVFDVMHSTLDKMGVPYKTTITPMKRIVAGLKKGTTNLTSLLKSPSLQPFTWALEPAFTQIRIVVFHQGKKLEIKKKEDLIGKNLIMLRGWTYLNIKDYYESLAKQGKIKLQYADSHEIAFKMLNKGRGDYLLEYWDPSQETLKKMDVPNLSHNVLMSVDVHVLISKTQPNAKAFKRRFEKAYQQVLKEKGIH